MISLTVNKLISIETLSMSELFLLAYESSTRFFSNLLDGIPSNYIQRAKASFVLACLCSR